MLLVVSIDESEKWDGIVRSFEDYDVYYLSGYVKAFQLHGDGVPVLFYYEAEGIRAVNVVMKRDISLDVHFAGELHPGEYYDFATPYGYGGYITEGDCSDADMDALDRIYTAYCFENNIISEYVRFHPVLQNKEKLNRIYGVEDKGKTISMDLDSQLLIWKNLTSKNRNMVRKAKKSGVNIYWGRSPELYKFFLVTYSSTMDEDNAHEYYYFKEPFFRSTLYDLKNNCMAFYAVYKDEIVAMSIILFANRQMHYHLSASNKDFQKLASGNLLLYEAACWGSANGYRTFHLGGGLHSMEDNLYKFKSSFNRGSNNIYAIGKKCFNQAVYDRLVAIRSNEKDFDRQALFFPLYRYRKESG